MADGTKCQQEASRGCDAGQQKRALVHLLWKTAWHTPAYNPAIPLLGRLPKRKGNICTHEDLGVMSVAILFIITQNWYFQLKVHQLENESAKCGTVRIENEHRRNNRHASALSWGRGGREAGLLPRGLPPGV